jgi:cell fate regulator YaaT (PSP1 superfamily)
MGCSNCGTADGKPGGCQSHGSCGTGSCNRMNVYDWLSNLPIHDPATECRVMEISFSQGSRKDFYRNTTTQIFEKGEIVSVEGVSGFDVGEVSLTGELVRIQMKKKSVDEFHPDMKKVLRRASERDLDLLKQNKAREKEAVIRSRAISRQLKLDMKVSQVEIQADGRKATFYYIADDRVDFRELIKIFASEFRVKVEMRQIGARQEAGKVGGIGSCGRELCCSTWLTDFKSVNTTAARYQNLSINQSKLSGQCGRLKCCLNYELDTYLDALQQFPENADTLQVAKGTALLIKKDIFKNLMWYVLPDSNKQYPLLIERVKQIKKLNQQNIVPDDLGAVEATGKPKEELVNVDLTGQFSLKTLDKADRKKREMRKGPNQQRRDNRDNRQGQSQQRDNRPPQSRDNRPQQTKENRSQPPKDNKQPPQQKDSRQQPPQAPRENRPTPPIKKP